ncbi:unnamed protein product [Malus baccata var. baccata]
MGILPIPNHEAHSRTTSVNMKPQRWDCHLYNLFSSIFLYVKVEDSFDPALEDESETIEHLLVEPKSEYVTVDGVLCGLHSAHPWGRHNEFELGVLDGLRDEVDEVEDIHALNDIGFIGQASELGFGSCEGSRKRNSCSCCWDESTVTIQEFECKNNSIDKAVTHEFHSNFRHKKKRHRTPVAYHNDEKPSVSGIVSAAFLKEKTLHKPTRRYIEEFPDKMSKDSKGREDCSAVTTTESRRSKVRSQNKHHHLRPRTLASQTLAEFRKQRACRKKDASISFQKFNCLCYSSQMLECDESDESYEKRSSKHDRRKHQRMWTPSEVTTLVDGISQCEVGRWTYIKRFLFASSPYRTPLDLRVHHSFPIMGIICSPFAQKVERARQWRNILRRICGKEQKNEISVVWLPQVEQKEMHALPKSLVPRVRELATVHPYPRQCGKKFALPILPIASKSASSDLIRRYVRRNNRFQSSIPGAVNQ